MVVRVFPALLVLALVSRASAFNSIFDEPIDFGARVFRDPNPPVPTKPDFTGNFHVKGTIHIPYAEIEEPFEAWRSVENKNDSKSRIDYYNGIMKTYQLEHPGKDFPYGTSRKVIWTTVGSVDVPTLGCFQVNGTKDANVRVQTVIPDLEGYALVKKGVLLDGEKCDLWRNVTSFGAKTNTYSFWVSRSDTASRHYIPKRFEMRGFNSLLGSHYDHYIIDYDSFDHSNPDETVFEVPANVSQCRNFPGPGKMHEMNPIGELILGSDHSRHEDDFSDFKRTHGKSYSSGEEHERRLSHYKQNARFIESFNRRGKTFTLAANHLMDLTPDELKVMRGRIATKGYNGGLPHMYSKEDLKSVPGFWDWRYLGAVTPVKDQSICGSCWSFGTTGHLEGAYFLKTGKLVRLSQQALIDCSWQFENNGCDGGEDFRAYEWMMKEGGIPTADSYGPYMGADGKCHARDAEVEKVGKIYGYVNVSSGDQEALKLAIFQQGPISVAIDASQRTFSFYSNGVFYEDKCKNGSDDLDHAVLAVGYGELKGEPYWLVKNSWSTYWGNDGYILMSMKNNNCGVATEPTFVVM
ncbi:unnamed protein product [Notodromas monacha]|uniref:Counting factor associated protein D n=1 Tax=Notodromas monacha TaxID=399045 RepID=A0A7R9GFN1_9CRUS|nr:unnamed protein product [Notodromas monacha]CAG0920852.1 unnamed protein product [Notodromas monacha]